MRKAKTGPAVICARPGLLLDEIAKYVPFREGRDRPFFAVRMVLRLASNQTFVQVSAIGDHRRVQPPVIDRP